MGVRKCIIKDCPSSSARTEDRGVTYHKIPANEAVKQQWTVACRLPENYVINKGSNVCSRHFRKADFQDFKGTKYVLKFGAIPTIFSWTIATTADKKESEKADKKEDVKVEKMDEEEMKKEDVKKEQEACSSVEVKPDPDGQKKEEEEEKDDKKEVIKEEEFKHEVADDDVVLKEDSLLAVLTTPKRKTPASKKKATPKRPTSTRTSASSSKKMRRSDPTPASSTKDSKKATISPRKSTSAISNNSQSSQINFAPGTKIEAQDFSGKWHPAKLLEVDTEEREVLVQFEKNGKSKSTLNDEWIPMDSVRLRPLQQPKTPNGKLKYAIGEKCFARWSDSRKFRATIKAILENEMYEVLFDDGFVKVCKASHISKLKKSLDFGQELEDVPTTPVKAEKDVSIADPPATPTVALHIPQVAKVSDYPEIPKSGEWCCHWMNDFPIGEEATIEVAGVKAYSVIVDDWRLPEGWVKHVYQRITAYGKMDVLLVNSDGKIFRSRQELKAFLAEKGETYDPNVFDFGLHKKRSKEMGFCHYTQEYQDALLPPLISPEPVLLNTEINIGSVKVKIIDNLLQCPEKDCLKTFRKENHLQIHIKHYHKELAKGLGEIPNMQDLASLRTPVEIVDAPPKATRRKSISASGSRTSLKEEIIKKDVVIKKEPDLEADEKCEVKREDALDELPVKREKLEQSLADKPSESGLAMDIKPETSNTSIPSEGPASASFDPDASIEMHSLTKPTKGLTKIKMFTSKKKSTKKTKAGFISKKVFKVAAAVSKKKKKRKLKMSRTSMDYMDADETRHSFATAGNDSFFRQGYSFDTENSLMTNASICGQYGDDSINAAVNSPKFISENGEMIKIVSMKKEEIINCLCGYGEEDGLMVQCELCLCWQHGVCNGFERDTQVPDKYVCYICRYPQGGRESRRYIHDQDWLYEGKLPVANYHVPNSKHPTRFDILKQSHMLGGNLLELKRFMHSLKVKINIAEKKDHPKMYLWSKKWEKSPPRGGNGDLSGIVPLNNSHQSTGTPQTLGKYEQKPLPVPQIPVPEAPIDPAECQAILLEHIQKQQNAAMARLQAIEAQIIALEAYDDKAELLESPTAKNYPKTKQTIHMLLNDLVKMKKISAIHRSAQQPLQ